MYGSTLPRCALQILQFLISKIRFSVLTRDPSSWSLQRFSRSRCIVQLDTPTVLLEMHRLSRLRYTEFIAPLYFEFGGPLYHEFDGPLYSLWHRLSVCSWIHRVCSSTVFLKALYMSTVWALYISLRLEESTAHPTYQHSSCTNTAGCTNCPACDTPAVCIQLNTPSS